MKFGLFGKAVLLAGVLSCGGLRADNLENVLRDWRTYLSEIKQCESVQTGINEYENKCTFYERALIMYVNYKITKIEEVRKSDERAANKARLDDLIARANNLKK